MAEKTFIMIKPRHAHLAADIFRELDSFGTRIKTKKIERVSEDVISDHYNFLREKPFFKGIINTYIGQTVVLAIYEGEDVIKRISKFIGPTDPKEADKETIRFRYGFPHSDNIDERKAHNVIHRSDSKESFEREIEIWKEHL